MKTNVQCCVIWFVDEDKKTFNPGVIITKVETDDEIGDIALDMREQGRNVRIFASHLVNSVNELPPLTQPLSEGLSGYTYDPWLMW
jgi:hypothetical protein